MTLPPVAVTLTLVLVALALLTFIYTMQRRIPTLGCALSSLIIVLAFVVLFISFPR